MSASTVAETKARLKRAREKIDAQAQSDIVPKGKANPRSKKRRHKTRKAAAATKGKRKTVLILERQ